MTLFELQSAIEPHLGHIEAILPEGDYTLTLLARYTGDKFKDADIIFTRDKFPEIISAIERLATR